MIATLIYVAMHRMKCPCEPCPWCTLRLPHDSSLQDVQVKLRSMMAEWSDIGCSVFQISLAVFSCEWIVVSECECV
jgi:hypothetical protein